MGTTKSKLSASSTPLVTKEEENCVCVCVCVSRACVRGLRVRARAAQLVNYDGKDNQ